MKIKHPIRISLAGAALVSGAALAAPATASATTPTAGFTQAQQKIEQKLASRVDQLRALSTDVTKATTLSASDASTLAARLTTETSSINTLVVTVPTDTTMTELRKARKTMIEGNRVFAVLTPQVFEVIEADSTASQVTTLQAGEAALQSSANSLAGEPGYRNAVNHYDRYVTAVNRAALDSAHVSETVIAQMPDDFPRDTHVFVSANRQLLTADVALAHANYDADVIGLASGGYTGP